MWGKYLKIGIKKKVQTQVGQITVKKGHVLEPKGHFRQSPYLQETALHLGQGHTFKESSQLLERLCGVDLSDKQTENLCHHYGEQLEDVAVEEVVEVPQEPTALHYALVDGSYILSREQGWVETKVGRLFKGEDNFAVSEKRNMIRTSDYVAHIGGHLDFVDKFSGLLNGLSNLVFLADGAPWIWKWISDCYPQAVQILDFYHAYEKLCQWAVLVIKDQQESSLWIEGAKALLLNDELAEVIIRIQDTACQGEGLDKKNALLTYLNNNAHRMSYKTFLDQGYLIGSGAIESAQRTVVQQRMKRSGQRWTLKGGQQVLNLRTKMLSNRWNDVTQLVRQAA